MVGLTSCRIVLLPLETANQKCATNKHSGPTVSRANDYQKNQTKPNQQQQQKKNPNKKKHILLLTYNVN